MITHPNTGINFTDEQAYLSLAILLVVHAIMIGIGILLATQVSRPIKHKESRLL